MQGSDGVTLGKTAQHMFDMGCLKEEALNVVLPTDGNSDGAHAWAAGQWQGVKEGASVLGSSTQEGDLAHDDSLKLEMGEDDSIGGGATVGTSCDKLLVTDSSSAYVDGQRMLLPLSLQPSSRQALTPQYDPIIGSVSKNVRLSFIVEEDDEAGGNMEVEESPSVEFVVGVHAMAAVESDESDESASDGGSNVSAKDSVPVQPSVSGYNSTHGTDGIDVPNGDSNQDTVEATLPASPVWTPWTGRLIRAHSILSLVHNRSR